MSPRERRLFLVAGCAAGVGAIFQCPLGGAIFATTVLYREPEIEGDALLPSIIASVTSYSTFMAFGGYGHHLLERTHDLKFQHPVELIPYTVLAVICALTGILFYHGLKGVPKLAARSGLPKWLTPAAAALVGGGIACALPQVMDSKYAFLQSVLDDPLATGHHSWMWAALLFAMIILAKCTATSLMMGSDSAGGLFGPVVFMGGAVGALTGTIMVSMFPSVFPEQLRQALIPVGMAGFLSASLRTPLAATVMVTEMTGSYGLIVPLMLVSILSYMLGRRWGVYSEQVGDQDESPAHAGESMISMLEAWRVSDLMDKAWPFVVSPSRPLSEVIAKADGNKLSTFAVVEGRRLAGTISVADLSQVVDLKEAPALILAADLMTSNPQVVYPNDDLYSTLELFRRYNVEALPVVEGDQDEFVGMLSRDSIHRALRNRLKEQRTHLLREHAGFEILARESLAEDFMSTLSAQAEGRIERQPVGADAVGKSLRQLDFRRRYDGQVIAIENPAEGLLTPPDPGRLLKGDDILIVLRQMTERRRLHSPGPSPR